MPLLFEQAFIPLFKKATGEHLNTSEIREAPIEEGIGSTALQFPLVTSVFTSEGSVLLSTKTGVSYRIVSYCVVLCCVVLVQNQELS